MVRLRASIRLATIIPRVPKEQPGLGRRTTLNAQRLPIMKASMGLNRPCSESMGCT